MICNRNRTQRELTNNKTQKGNFHLKIILKDVFGVSQCQEKRTLELGYKLTKTRGTDNGVLKN